MAVKGNVTYFVSKHNALACCRRWWGWTFSGWEESDVNRIPRVKDSNSFAIFWTSVTKILSVLPLCSWSTNSFSQFSSEIEGSSDFSDVNPSRRLFRIGSSLANTIAIWGDAIFAGGSVALRLAAARALLVAAPGATFRLPDCSRAEMIKKAIDFRLFLG